MVGAVAEYAQSFSPDRDSLKPRFDVSIYDFGEPWYEEAECRVNPTVNADDFFQERGYNNTAKARKVCLVCPVKAECLDYALETKQEFGIWGGLTVTQRKRLVESERKERKARGES